MLYLVGTVGVTLVGARRKHRLVIKDELLHI